jgi:hypothetical protein
LYDLTQTDLICDTAETELGRLELRITRAPVLLADQVVVALCDYNDCHALAVVPSNDDVSAGFVEGNILELVTTADEVVNVYSGRDPPQFALRFRTLSIRSEDDYRERARPTLQNLGAQPGWVTTSDEALSCVEITSPQRQVEW